MAKTKRREHGAMKDLYAYEYRFYARYLSGTGGLRGA